MNYTVLMYHEIRRGDEKVGDNPIDVSNKYQDILPTPLYCDYDDFVKQMAYLVMKGYNFITLQEVRAYHEGKLDLPKNSVLLSFDDAYQSVLEYAYPILKKHNIKATLFLVSGWLHKEGTRYSDKKSRTLTYEEVLSMKDVFELANHTHVLHERDASMRSNLMDASIDVITKDLRECDKYVDVKDMFAYPFGFYDEETISKLKACGIKYGFTSDPGVNDTDTDLMHLHRYPVFYGCTLEQFKDMLV